MAMASKLTLIAALESLATCSELRMTQNAKIALVVLGVTLKVSLISRANAALVTSVSLDRHQQHPHL
jgi:hypothetical protein